MWPGQAARVVGTSSCPSEGWGFHPWSGHAPRLRVQAPAGACAGAIGQCFSLSQTNKHPQGGLKRSRRGHGRAHPVKLGVAPGPGACGGVTGATCRVPAEQTCPAAGAGRSRDRCDRCPFSHTGERETHRDTGMGRERERVPRPVFGVPAPGKLGAGGPGNGLVLFVNDLGVGVSEQNQQMAVRSQEVEETDELQDHRRPSAACGGGRPENRGRSPPPPPPGGSTGWLSPGAAAQEEPGRGRGQREAPIHFQPHGLLTDSEWVAVYLPNPGSVLQ